MSKNNIVYEFSFNEQLPRIYEVVYGIISASLGAAFLKKGKPTSANVAAAIHGCSIKLKELWEKAFGASTIKSLTALKKQIQKKLDSYSLFMKRKNDTRTVKKSYRIENSELLDCLSPNVNTNDFDENK